MDHLKSAGVVVHLDLPLHLLEERIANLDSRGVVMAPGQTLGSLFDERQPLCEQYADVRVLCAGLAHEQVVSAVIAALEGWE